MQIEQIFFGDLHLNIILHKIFILSFFLLSLFLILTKFITFIDKIHSIKNEQEIFQHFFLFEFYE